LIFHGAEQHHNKKSFIEAVREVRRSVIFVVYAQLMAYICLFHRISDLTLCRYEHEQSFLDATYQSNRVSLKSDKCMMTINTATAATTTALMPNMTYTLFENHYVSEIGSVLVLR
jgi:hypothetical protein